MKKPINLIKKDDGTSALTVPEEYTSQIITFAYNYLQEEGYFHDELKDSEGFIPWFTYPSIAFLKDILRKDHKVLEYGCGYSSLFFKKHAGELYTVEHDERWANTLLEHNENLDIKLAPANSEIHVDAAIHIQNLLLQIPPATMDNDEADYKHGLINDQYAGYASRIYDRPNKYFDIIIIDGMARSLCAMLAVDRIKDDGYIIVDNSDRHHYNFIQRHLINSGFKRIDFWGPGYYNYHKWCTSFYSKNFNIVNTKIERPVNKTFV